MNYPGDYEPYTNEYTYQVFGTMTAHDKQIGGDHYTVCIIQPRDYANANGFNYDECNVLRYLTRHRRKNGRKDIEKAIHCLQLILGEYDDPRP